MYTVCMYKKMDACMYAQCMHDIHIWHTCTYIQSEPNVRKFKLRSYLMQRCVGRQYSVLGAKWTLSLHQVRHFRGLCQVFHHHVPRAIILLFFLQVTTVVAAATVLAAGMKVALRINNTPLHVHVHMRNTACPVHTYIHSTYTECTPL